MRANAEQNTSKCDSTTESVHSASRAALKAFDVRFREGKEASKLHTTHVHMHKLSDNNNSPLQHCNPFPATLALLPVFP